MGHYLDMANSDETNPQTGTVPNQNYAREVLQLFSIGLVALNPDGTQQLDATRGTDSHLRRNNNRRLRVGVYRLDLPAAAGCELAVDQPDQFRRRDGGIPGSPRVGHESAFEWLYGSRQTRHRHRISPMRSTIFSIIRTSARSSVSASFSIWSRATRARPMWHVSRRYLPTTASGVRGDLGAVVRAILTDTEARGVAPAANIFGHLREPALFITSASAQSRGSIGRCIAAQCESPRWVSPFSPRIRYSVSIRRATRFRAPRRWRPEFGIQNAATALARANFVNTLIMQNGAAPDPTVGGSTGTTINLTPLSAPPAAMRP